MSIGWGIVIAGALVCLGLVGSAFFSGSGDAASVLLTAFIVIFTFFNVRAARNIEWFTGAMARHSDQMRQLAARNQKVKMVLWDKTAGDGTWPFDGKHGKEAKLEVMYIGVPPEHRKVQPGLLARFIGG